MGFGYPKLHEIKWVIIEERLFETLNMYMGGHL